MQISRHWRMKALRYRLEGVRTNANESARTQQTIVEQRVEQQEQPASPAPALAVKRATAAR